MTVAIDTITFDCADTMRLARFWGAALGWEVDDDSDDEGASVRPRGGGTVFFGQGLYFQRVPEGKVVKNRVHIDLRPGDAMATEVERLRGLGATLVGRVDVEGSFWTVMQGPEGNELCVLRGPEDGWTAEG
jgi:catechol 2,3-dioxygenase-like lactoylglutathione lyase family enzyme